MSLEAAPFDYERSMERQRLGWSLAALAAMAAPHALHLAVWITACAALLAGWTLAGAWRGWRLPGRYGRYALGVLAFAGVLATFRTLNGAEAGSALLLLLAMLKFMEAQGLRDYFLLMVIAYFLGIANFLYDQTVPLALYMLPAVWLVTVALLNVAHPDPERSFRESARSAARLLLPALPAAAVLFLLFPRISGPLWGFASLKHSGVTGLSSSMSPGDLSQLAQSDDVAFRVKFDGPAPPQNLLYWRALVLHDYDGHTWSTGNVPWQRQLVVNIVGTPIHYAVTLEPNNLSVLYALDLPVKIPDDTALSASYEIGTRAPVTERKLYSATSYTKYDYGSDMPGWMLHRDLTLPHDGNPRARALAQGWHAASVSPAEIVQDALRMFNKQTFSYTLQPGELRGSDRVDQFLFDTRRGFCEHYAGAFVFLMRAAGIPAHVVIGYQGGAVNPLDGYYVVRQREAHAWAEVWLSDKGWVRVDPTAAVDPARVEQGLAASLPEDDLAVSMFDVHPWLGNVRNSWDALNTGWNQWVLAYGPELQERFYKKVGLDYGNWLQLAFVLGAIFFLIMSVYWLYLRWERRPPPLTPVVRDYARFCARLARLGLTRARHEGPLDYAARVRASRPDLDPAVMEITRAYIVLRYADAGDARDFRNKVRDFRPRPLASG
jgi:transglutaminase-like putative cysteine protease